MHKLYIHPKCQRKGAGSQMIRHVDEEARAGGFANLVLGVNKANHQAIAAYKKSGFVIRASVTTDIGNGFVMNDYIMRKPLHDSHTLSPQRGRGPG